MRKLNMYYRKKFRIWPSTIYFLVQQNCSTVKSVKLHTDENRKRNIVVPEKLCFLFINTTYDESEKYCFIFLLSYMLLYSIGCTNASSSNRAPKISPFSSALHC